MEVGGKILKCAISWRRLIVERNGLKVRILGPRKCTHVCRPGYVWYVSCSSSFWGHSVHFAKFPMLRFPYLLLPRFQSFNFNRGWGWGVVGVVGWWVETSYFWRSEKLKKICQFEILLTQYDAEIFKLLLLSTSWGPWLPRSNTRMQAIVFLGNRPRFKNFVALSNVNMRVNGKSLKCVISWKRLIVEWNGWKFGTRYWELHI